MTIAKHGFGHKYRHIYDETIIDYIMNEDSKHNTKRTKFWMKPVVKRHMAHRYISKSFSDLYRVIKARGYPTVSRTTIQRHLNRMIREHVLIKYPKKGQRYNQTLYTLDTNGLVIYGMKRLMRSLVALQRTEQRLYDLEFDY